jgi:hypothetical protein
MIKKGDKFTVTKPADTDEGPSWIKEMDRYTDKELVASWDEYTMTDWTGKSYVVVIAEGFNWDIRWVKHLVTCTKPQVQSTTRCAHYQTKSVYLGIGPAAESIQVCCCCKQEVK